MEKLVEEFSEERYYGVMSNLIGETVQDLDSYSWKVINASERQRVAILISEEEVLSSTRMRIVSDINFFNSYYQYKGKNGEPKRIRDIYG